MMSRFRQFALPSLLLSCALSQPALASGDDVADLIATDKRLQRAYVDRDWAVLDEIFTDDYVLVVSSGEERTKAQIIQGASSPDAQWEINETSDWKVRVYGDSAIVVATLHQKGTDHGTPFDSVVKFSDTYIRENGKWRNVHAHASKAAPINPPTQ